MTKLKICCIKSIEEAVLAYEMGANAIGLVGHMPSGPGVIDDVLIRQITEEMRDNLETFLLTSETRATAIINHHQRVLTSTIQLVDDVSIEDLKIIRSELPDISIVQVIHVIDEQSLLDANTITPYVDVLLLDSGNPNLKIKKLGGTGQTHNWDISRKIVKSSPIPVYLAGGLNVDNVRSAIAQVQPYGIDLCSGVRINDQLNREKVESFVARVNYQTDG